jgi:hypothetical protein
MGTAFSYAGVQAGKEGFIQIKDALAITKSISAHWKIIVNAILKSIFY